VFVLLSVETQALTTGTGAPIGRPHNAGGKAVKRVSTILPRTKVWLQIAASRPLDLG
jgi:hypothetical protein